ncbi:MAG TPA: hypothetical protein VN047_05855 [Sphingopyxis sp.]|uniref:hypothetical protein n=1 Tax=Sphingopyxis sp. TaxID=1908224 RepID=UPI002CBF0E89|nr:hypothetical protein [Sphingopyxis sp.]HWW56396.1 hypothetical protein [Sphingopyxis sp.]
MKSSTDIIAAALDAALSPRPLSYTSADLAKTVVIALDYCGFAIVPVDPTEEMTAAGGGAVDCADSLDAIAIYRAMIEARVGQ